ncbi:MAG: hypothetical protein QXU52_03860 [Fervidicoccaceae archaeon]
MRPLPLRPVVAVAFASRIHPREEAEASLGEILRAAPSLPVRGVVASEEEARRKGEELVGSIPIALVLTGGTSRMIEAFASSGRFRGLLLVAGDARNSLPSALSARSRLSELGVGSALYLCRGGPEGECGAALSRALSVARAAASLAGARILLVANEPPPASEVEGVSRFGASMEVASWDEALRAGSGGGAGELEKSLGFSLSGGEASALRTIADIYAGIKRLCSSARCDAVAVDCFPLIAERGVAPCLVVAALNAEGAVAACEADLRSLALMILMSSLAGSPAWMANLSSVSGGLVHLAHCTAPPTILERAELAMHFESGRPYSLAGRLRTGIVTVASMSRRFDEVRAFVAGVVASGRLSERMCRTQAALGVQFDGERLLEEAPANHHVLVAGDVRRGLREACGVLGLRYREIA